MKSKNSQKKPKIYCHRGSPNAHRIIAAMDVDMVRTPLAADLLWIRRRARTFYSDLSKHQLISHIPNHLEMTDKGRLTHNLKLLNRIRTEDELRMQDFYPESYRLFTDKERNQFLEQVPEKDRKDNLWVFKPTNLSSGNGIKVMWKLNNLKNQLKGTKGDTKIDFGAGASRYIAQRHVKDMLLLNKRKSEIRAYWLIANIEPLMVLMYNDGFARLCSKEFVMDDFDNQLIHVTNIHQQTHHADYDPEQVLKWDFAKLEDHIVNDLKLAEAGVLDNVIKPRLKQIIDYVSTSAIDDLRNRPDNGLFFSLYGCDFILDKSMRPWLTEVQSNPGLDHEDPSKAKVLVNMLHEAIDIQLEIQERIRNKDFLTDLSSVKNFEWVINEAQDYKDKNIHCR